MPILVKSKDDLINELRNKSYTDDEIDAFIKRSNYG
jgi:hypothetical protein